MKCIRCQKDCTYPQRSNKKCPSCGGEFAFEPRTGDKLSDAAFQAAIEAVSAKGSLRWGVEHLYYEICRRVRRKSAPFGCVIAAGAAAVVAALAGLISGEGILCFFFIVLVIMAAVLWLVSRRATVSLALTDFNKMWARWNSVHGAPAGVIVRQTHSDRLRKVEPDLGDYSFDRAVICDRARTVDLLLANNFHFENNCAVLSVNGYPARPFETIRAMLKRNPRLQVFALHDATPAGCMLAHKLASDTAWFAGQVKVVDVGLRPVHAKPFNGLLLPHTGIVPPHSGYSPEEAEWLAKYSLELAAIRPEQILKRLFRAINHQFDPAESTDTGSSSSSGGDGCHFEYDNNSFGSDASSSDGGADSFG